VEVDETSGDLEVALRLHEAAHHAEGHDGLLPGRRGAGEEGGDDRVIRPFAAGDWLTWPGVRTKHAPRFCR